MALVSLKKQLMPRKSSLRGRVSVLFVALRSNRARSRVLSDADSDHRRRRGVLADAQPKDGSETVDVSRPVSGRGQVYGRRGALGPPPRSWHFEEGRPAADASRFERESVGGGGESERQNAAHMLRVPQSLYLKR